MGDEKVDIRGVLEQRVRDRTEQVNHSKRVGMSPFVVEAGVASLRKAMTELDTFMQLIDAAKKVVKECGHVSELAEVLKRIA